MKETVHSKIIEFLRTKNTWVWGGQIEDHVRAVLGSKASNASRVCRKLEENGVLVKRMEPIPGQGATKYVQYRLKDPNYKPKGYVCCPSFGIFKTHAVGCPEGQVKPVESQKALI